MKSYSVRAGTQPFALMVLIRPLHSEAWLVRDGDPSVFLIGLSSSLHSEAWLVRGGHPAVCSHRVEQLTAF